MSGPIDRPDWPGDGEGGVSEIVPSPSPPSEADDDPNSALVATGAISKEDLESLQSGEVARLDSVPAKPAPGEGSLDAGLLAEWEQTGGIQHHQETAQNAVRGILEGLPEASAEEMLQTFDSMPVGAQTAVFRELALTPRHRGTEQDALDRLDRIEATMSSSDLEATAAWVKSRTPEQMAAILKALGG